MRKSLRATVVIVVSLNCMNAYCGSTSAAAFEERFLEACIADHRGVTPSYAKKVCECILATARDSGIDFLHIMAYEYKKRQIIPTSGNFHNAGMRIISDDCFKIPVKLIVGSDSAEFLSPFKKQYLFPFGTVPTKEFYITFTNEKKQTVLFQSNGVNYGSGDRASMSVGSGGDLCCTVQMIFIIDPKYHKDRMELVGKRIPLQELVLRIEDWRRGHPREIWKQVSSTSGNNNYVSIDSVKISPANSLSVWGTIHCMMTSDGTKFIYELNDGKFSLNWLYY